MMKRRDLITLLGGAAVMLCGDSVMSDTRAASTAVTTQSHVARQRVTFKSEDRPLSGVLYKPSGGGPFPALIWRRKAGQPPFF
jgi:hypothetical protein